MPSTESFVRWATLRGVRARGALTRRAVWEMWRLPPGQVPVGPAVDALVDDGLVTQRAVADGGPSVLIPPGSEPGDAPGPVLVSPFDNLVWDRAFLERAFGFRHVIEVYKKDHERVYGYYVLPLLWRDRLVGRADLRHDREARTLVLKAFHREPGVRQTAGLADALDQALNRLAPVISAESVLRL